MTLTEFLHPLKGKAWRELILATLYFRKKYGSQESLTVEELRAHMKQARVPKVAKANLAEALARSAPYVETSGKKGAGFLWRITSTGVDHVRNLMGLPEHDVEVQHDISCLESLLKKIVNSDCRVYVEEALKCLKVGALRASIVFLWAGAVRIVESEIMKHGIIDVNAAISKHEKNPRKVKRVDDLSFFKESTLLLVAQELGLFDRNQRSILEDALKLRNKCGHPGKYGPGPKKASSFIEDVMSVVFV